MSQLLPGYLVPGNAVVNMVRRNDRQCFSDLIRCAAFKILFDTDTADQRPDPARHEAGPLYEDPTSNYIHR